MWRMAVMLAALLAGCTNVTQMRERYAAGDESQLDRLMEIAGRPDYPYATRRKAAQALGEIGDRRAVPVLVSVLGEYEQRTTLRQDALTALGRIGDPQAVAPIGRMLDTQVSANSADVRLAALQTLGGLGGAEAAAILLNALRYYDMLMAYSEQRVMRGVYTGEEQPDPYAPAYADTAAPRGRGRMPPLGLLPEDQRPPVGLFGTAVNDVGPGYDPTPEERRTAHAALVRVGGAAVPVIEQFLETQHSSPGLRRELLGIIEEIGGESR